ncbi:MAG TPA: hypothetical protein VHS52_04185 [Acidimicrobiales bacterium]|nr:hypothetical protein [Acidimicrobiales bacterium]
MARARTSGAAAPEARVPGTGPAYRLVPWLVGALWAALPFTAGPALADALHGAGGPVRMLASTGLWAGWAAAMVAAAIPHPVALTALRTLAPAAVAAAVASAAAGHGTPLAVGWAVVVLAWVFSPAVGARCVNGPAYPNERRYLLRAPGPLLFGPLPLAWALAVAGVCAGPLLLAARRWVLGGVCLVIGVPLAVVLVRSIHNLSRRWAVFVPAGFVLHDPLALLDPILFTRRTVTTMRPATVGEGLDLTQGAPGLALELVVGEPVSLTLMKPGRRQGTPESATRIVFTPTRPGAVMDEARSRHIRVG